MSGPKQFQRYTIEKIAAALAESAAAPPPIQTAANPLALPPKKTAINLRIDSDVIDWFKTTGKGYQTRINNVLRAFVDTQKS
jgi:uncharacterized protein (DUF4415 family)